MLNDDIINADKKLNFFLSVGDQTVHFFLRLSIQFTEDINFS